MKTVLVLEDMPHRIEWLKKYVGQPNTSITWVETVKDFFKRLESINKDDLALIILDHDLGGVPDFKSGMDETVDEYGHNGNDVVYNIDESYNDIPVLVWSCNTPAADRMLDGLREKGFSCVAYPFIGFYFKHIQQILFAALEE